MSTNKDVLYKKTSTGKYTTQALAAFIQIKSGAVIKPADLNKIIKKSNFDYTTGSGCSESEYVWLTNALRGNPFTLISPYVFRKVVFSVIGRHIDEDDIDECLKPCLEGEDNKQRLSPMQRAFDAVADGSMADFLNGSYSSNKKPPEGLEGNTPDLAAIINDPKTAEVLRNVRGIAQLMGAESTEIPNVVAKASKELFGDQFFKLFTRVETAGCADVEVGEAVVKASVAKGGVTKVQAVEKDGHECWMPLASERYSYRPSKPKTEKPISTSELAKLLGLSTVAMNHELIKHGFLIKSDRKGGYNKVGPAGKAYHVVDLSTSKRMWKPEIVDVVRKLI